MTHIYMDELFLCINLQWGAKRQDKNTITTLVPKIHLF